MNAVLLILFGSLLSYGSAVQVHVPKVRRARREASGALDIVTNHASPIHADVTVDIPTHIKPCPNKIMPSKIEPGIVFQVTPPKDAVYEVQSLRKSYPLTSRLDLVRVISRVAAVAAIILLAALELYPVAVSIFNGVYELFYFNKY